jgi:peptidoglycan/LPS O-acetylase OafA/YrhL
MDAASSPAPLPHAVSQHIKYRRDIDGLRAIAVLSVVAYHAFPKALPGGFIGVDIFFVISGFLISKILLDGLADGTFRFRDFYRRRVKRIFPALILVLATCASVGWFVLTPSDFRALGKHIVAGSVFVSNLLLWQEASYFDTAAKLKPLLHLWSLGVEEQFYLIWPLALWVAWKSRFSTWKLTAGVIAASFLLSIWAVRVDASSAFYSPVSRFWELLIGALLAHVSLPAPRLPGAIAKPAPIQFLQSAASKDAQSVVGLCCIVGAALFLNEGMAFPGWWALLPTTGAYLMIAAGPDGFVNRHLLAKPILVFVGLISYPLYLWHWPLLAFARIAGSAEPSTAMRAGLMAMSIGLAWLTYLFIERPVRFGRKRNNVLVLASLMTLLAFGGGITWAKDGFESRYKQDIAPYANFQYDFKGDARVGTCWLDDKAAGDAFSPACIDNRSGSTKPLMVVWGDSHAARLFPGLRLVLGRRFDLAQFTRDACAPFFNVGYANCVAGNAFVMARIAQLRPSVVILFAYWTHHMAGDPSVGTAKLEETVKALHAAGVGRIVVIGPAPVWNTPLPNNLVQLQKTQGLDYVPSRTHFGLDPAASAVDVYLKGALANREEVTYFSALDAMCNHSGCLTRTADSANSLTSWDYGHLTTAGAEYLSTALVNSSRDFQSGD